MEDTNVLNMGWICPNCGKALAPWVKYCNCFQENTSPSITGTGSSLTYIPKYKTVNISARRICLDCKYRDDSVVLTSNPPKYCCKVDGAAHFTNYECKFNEAYLLSLKEEDLQNTRTCHI